MGKAIGEKLALLRKGDAIYLEENAPPRVDREAGRSVRPGCIQGCGMEGAASPHRLDATAALALCDLEATGAARQRRTAKAIRRKYGLWHPKHSNDEDAGWTGAGEAFA